MTTTIPILNNSWRWNNIYSDDQPFKFTFILRQVHVLKQEETKDGVHNCGDIMNLGNYEWREKWLKENNEVAKF